MSRVSGPFSRRRFLAASSTSIMMPIVFARAAASPPTGSKAPSPPQNAAQPPVPAEAKGLTAYTLGPQIWIRWDNRLVTCYRAHNSQKYPYLYPLAGPASGLSLTSETSLPYPHHRSLFFGCDRVNGANYWQEGYDQGQIVSSGPRISSQNTSSVEILDDCSWLKPGQSPVMKDHRRITISIASDHVHFIDWEIHWSALVPVVIQKTNHSLFALRAAADITPAGGGRLVNTQGQSGEKNTFGIKSSWCDFSGLRDGFTDTVEGIAIFDHPSNPWSPCPWFTRDYGFISPTPFNFREDPWELPAGKTIQLRYRVVLHTGSPEGVDLAGQFDRWTKA